MADSWRPHTTMSLITEDDFGSDFSDDDDDLVALTLKPLTTHNAGNEDDKVQQQILAAKGEIAVLRAKIQALESRRHEEYETVVKETGAKDREKSQRIHNLEQVVKRLESEKKFLSVEMRNLSHRKRKRPQREPLSSQDDSALNTPEPQTPTTTASTIPLPIQAPLQPSRQRETVKISPIFKDDNSLLIDAIMCYTIPSTSKPTIQLLSLISLSESFTFESFTVNKNEPLSTGITSFLISQRPVLRLDMFITKIIHFLTSLVSQLFIKAKEYNRFSIPYLQALIHPIIQFKPSALTKSTTRQLCITLSDMVSHLLECIKPMDDLSNELYYYQRHKRLAVSGLQFLIVRHLTLLFSVELIESLLLVIKDDHEFVKELVAEAQLSTFVKHFMNPASNVVLMMSLANWLNCIIDSYEASPLSDLDIKLIAQLIEDGVELKRDWLFHGLNRCLGNNLECAYVEQLLGDELKDTPTVIYKITPTNKFNLELQHDKHRVLLQCCLVDVFTNLIISIPSTLHSFNNKPDAFKNLVFAIGRSQECLLLSPRSPITHLFSQFISSLIRFIHLIWEMSTLSDNAGPQLTKDSSHGLVISLARVAFSTTGTSRQAAEFLLSIREHDSTTPVFNKWAEDRALQLSHVDIDVTRATRENVMSIVQAQMGFSNGIEFAYDDDVVECARDVLEKCTTMDEADALYLAMNITTVDEEMSG